MPGSVPWLSMSRQRLEIDEEGPLRKCRSVLVTSLEDGFTVFERRETSSRKLANGPAERRAKQSAKDVLYAAMRVDEMA